MRKSPQELPANIIGFLRAVGSHWVSLMGGGIITVALGMYAYFSGRNIPPYIYIPVIIIFVFFGCYLAWRDSQTELVKLGNKEARTRAFQIERLRELIKDYNHIDEGIYGSRDLANWGKAIKSRTYHERAKGFLGQHFGDSAVEQFKERGAAFLEELLGKLVAESLEAKQPLP